MKSLLEVIRDLNTVKSERANVRIAIPGQEQADENFALIGELLEGTGIEQAEVAGVSMEVGASAVNSLSAEGGGLDAGEMMALFASIWIDGLIVGARYAGQAREDYGDLTVHDLAEMDDEAREEALAWVKEQRLYGSESGETVSEGTEPRKAPETPWDGSEGDISRSATWDDPRGERDR